MTDFDWDAYNTGYDNGYYDGLEKAKRSRLHRRVFNWFRYWL